VFDHGDLRLVIMALLAERPRYGYEIIKALEERVGGDYSPSPGVIYPNLTLLEEVGHATVSEERGGRRLYTLSEEGLAYLAANKTAADAILARVDEGAIHRAGPPPQVVRALENLTTSVRLRLKGRNATDIEIRAIADAIDAAARTVEDV
jgi:DNA-binding PadR family transcriptional regulator